MQVKARVTHIKDIEAGTGVSYGHRFVADRPLRIAVIGIGYADGVPRALSNQMQVLIDGQRVRQIGNITMDQMMLDVSPLPNLQEGDVVTLLGQSGADCITADDWANPSRHHFLGNPLRVQTPPAPHRHRSVPHAAFRSQFH
jgi:alanine racemase